MIARKVQISAAHILAAASPFDNTPGRSELEDLRDEVRGLSRVLEAVLDFASPDEQLELYRKLHGGTQHYRERYAAEFVAEGGVEE